VQVALQDADMALAAHDDGSSVAEDAEPLPFADDAEVRRCARARGWCPQERVG
jgi:hypothetical protein